MNLNRQETGRSMVEILGVLAVVGVLSVIGIAAYITSMNKYRANELLEQSNRRAVIIAGLITSGHIPSMDEFTNNNLGYAVFDEQVYGENGNDPWTKNDRKFALKIRFISKEVCKKLQNSVSNLVQNFEPAVCEDDATIVLTYNNDLSKEKIEDESTDNEPEGADCSAYKETSSKNTGGFAGYAADGASHCKCPSRQKWNIHTASCEDLDPNECTSYTSQECEDGYYCSFENSATCYNCSESGGGTCLEGIGTCTPLTNGTRVTTAADGFSGLLTGTKMNWWTANSWCVAHGMKIPSLSEFECFKDDTKPSGWDCDWSRFKGRLSANWWVSDNPDCRARNLAANGNRVDFDTPRKEKYYSTLCTNGEVQQRVLSGDGETCTNSSDCVKGFFCNDEKKCQEKLDDGEVCPSSEACKSGQCEQNGDDPDTCSTSCTSHTTNECGTGYYCVFNYPNDCSDSGTGACMPIINGTTLTASADGIDGYLISKKMNWWTASSLCAAHNMHLASLSEMGCSRGDSCVNCCEDKTRFYGGKLNGNGVGSWWASDNNNCLAYNVTLNGGTRVDFDTQRTNKTYYSVVCVH